MNFIFKILKTVLIKPAQKLQTGRPTKPGGIGFSKVSSSVSGPLFITSVDTLATLTIILKAGSCECLKHFLNPTPEALS